MLNAAGVFFYVFQYSLYEDMKKVLTLTIIHQQPRVLLGLKKRGFGAGRWNGFGGKVAAGEPIEAAAARELQEEAGIAAVQLEKVGLIQFEFSGDPEILEVHIFRAEEFLGTPTESEEMKPQWFGVDAIPFNEMWPDDIYWLPLLLAGKKFKGKFLFDGPDTIIEQQLAEVGSLVFTESV